MYPQIDNGKTNIPSSASTRILIADSDPSTTAQIISNTDREFRGSIQVSKNYYDLLEKITEDPPNVLILGKIDKFNCFDICQECHKIRENLSIVLLSRQSMIDDSFRQLALSKGATDIITNEPEQLNRLFQKLKRVQTQPLANVAVLKPAITGQRMLTAMIEISEIGSNYFGALAQGNYWRKAHARIVDEFPSVRNWSADHFGKLDCNETILKEELTDEDIQSLRIWVGLFIEECQRIIVDFGEILNNSELSPTARQLLAKD